MTINPFDYWVRKTIPAVYSDDLSYYELIEKVVEKLNEVVDSTNGFLNKDFKTYVSDKLTEWKNDGALDQIINESVFNDLKTRFDQTVGVSVVFYGAKGDGVTDDTQAFIDTIQYAVDNQLSTVFVPNGKYLIKESIDIPSGIRLSGLGKPIQKWANVDNQTGSLILCDMSQQNYGFILNAGSGLEHLTFYYPNQDFNKWNVGQGTYPKTGAALYQPIVYAPTVHGSGSDLSLIDLFFVNSYHAIDLSADHARHYIKKVRITPISKGITVGRCPDVGRIDDVHIFPFWSEAFNYANNSMRVNLFAELNAIGVEIGASDGQIINNLTCVGCNEGLKFSDLGGQGCQGAEVIHFMQDLGFKGINIQSGTHIKLDGVYLVPINPQSRGTAITDESCFGIMVNSGGFITIDNVNILACDGMAIRVKQCATKTIIKNVVAENCAYKGVMVQHTTPGAYLFRLSLEDISISCLTSSVIPYEFHEVTLSSIKNLTWLGVTPDTKVVSSGLTDTCIMDLNTLEGAQSYQIKGVTQQQPIFAKVDIDGIGNPTITSLTNGVSLVLNAFDGYAKTLAIPGKTIRGVIGVRGTTGGQLNPCSLVSEVSDPTWLRLVSFATNGFVSWNDGSAINKSYLIQILVD